MAPTDRFVTETRLRVRYAETDAMGIVHHSSYIVYFEVARSDYARQRGSSYESFEATGHHLAVSEINARYHQPARYDQEITVRCWITAMQSRAMTFHYEITDPAGTLLVDGSTRHICITQDGRVAKLPPSWREWT
jgi:acyl-CoA thioester hydrolase